MTISIRPWRHAPRALTTAATTIITSPCRIIAHEMSSFVQASPVIYGTPFGGKYPAPSTADNCYYAAGCHAGQTAVGNTFYGAEVDSGRCYARGGDYDTGPYSHRTAGYGGGRYGQLSQEQQQQQQHRMFVSEYRPPSVYRGYCIEQPAPGSEELLYASEELARPAGNSPSAGVVPASSPVPSAGLCSRYSPPSAPPVAVPQRVNNPPQPPVIYPWMKMVHSISGELRVAIAYEILRHLLPPPQVGGCNVLTRVSVSVLFICLLA